jgi:NUBPL iron-transfer P-loop NTPase
MPHAPFVMLRKVSSCGRLSSSAVQSYKIATITQQQYWLTHSGHLLHAAVRILRHSSCSTGYPCSARCCTRCVRCQHPSKCAPQVPCVAVVENMSFFDGEDGRRYTPFGAGSGDRIQREFGLPHLIRFPIAEDISQAGDGASAAESREPVAQGVLGFKVVAAKP